MPTHHTLMHHYWKELLGLFTLGVSLWIAFGPLRHRLPRILTRFGKYSATFKLLLLSSLCWIGLYRNMMDDDPSLALNWVLAGLGSILFMGAVFVLTRRQGLASRSPTPPQQHPAPVPPPVASKQAHPKPMVRKSSSAQALP